MTVASCTCSTKTTPIDLLGVPIYPLSPQEALEQFEDLLSCRASHVWNHLAVDPIALALKDVRLREALNAADVNLPDGAGVVWGARLLGEHNLRRRVYGPDFLLSVADWGIPRGLRHAFIGGTPETLDQLEVVLRSRFPGLAVIAKHAPPIREVTESGVIEDLEALAASPDVLWVGLGVPKQLIWANLAKRHQPARVVATVGAAFDFISGGKRQAPKWMQEHGLEWLFRLSSEPRRLWRRYLFGNTSFVAAVARQRFTGRRVGAGRG